MAAVCLMSNITHHQTVASSIPHLWHERLDLGVGQDYVKELALAVDEEVHPCQLAMIQMPDEGKEREREGEVRVRVKGQWVRGG